MLAQQFRSGADYPGKTFNFVSGAIGWSIFAANYGNCLRASVGEAGLGLRIFFLFRPLHPPLLIPWSAVEAVSRARFIFRMRTVIALRGFKRRISLYGAAGDEVAAVFQAVQPDAGMARPAISP